MIEMGLGTVHLGTVDIAWFGAFPLGMLEPSCGLGVQGPVLSSDGPSWDCNASPAYFESTEPGLEAALK